LAGILRLADGLDFTHQSLVQMVEAHVALENVTFQGQVLLNPILEEYAVNKKKDLFEKTFKTKVVITWKQVQRLQQQPSLPIPSGAMTNFTISQNVINSDESNVTTTQTNNMPNHKDKSTQQNKNLPVSEYYA
jgi:hypothetical protein